MRYIYDEPNEHNDYNGGVSPVPEPGDMDYDPRDDPDRHWPERYNDVQFCEVAPHDKPRPYPRSGLQFEHPTE